jgi:hypothetical protein
VRTVVESGLSKPWETASLALLSLGYVAILAGGPLLFAIFTGICSMQLVGLLFLGSGWDSTVRTPPNCTPRKAICGISRLQIYGILFWWLHLWQYFPKYLYFYIYYKWDYFLIYSSIIYYRQTVCWFCIPEIFIRLNSMLLEYWDFSLYKVMTSANNNLTSSFPMYWIFFLSILWLFMLDFQ